MKPRLKAVTEPNYPNQIRNTKSMNATVNTADDDTRKIQWQYFRPEDRPFLVHDGVGDNGESMLSINLGPVREYVLVCELGDIRHMRCGDLHLQAKKRETFGLSEGGWSVRAVNTEFIDKHPADFGGDEITVNVIGRIYTARTGVVGTYREQRECTAEFSPINTEQNAALQSLDRLISALNLAPITSEQLTIRLPDCTLVVDFPCGGTGEHDLKALQAIRDRVSSDWEVSDTSDIPF